MSRNACARVRRPASSARPWITIELWVAHKVDLPPKTRRRILTRMSLVDKERWRGEAPLGCSLSSLQPPQHSRPVRTCAPAARTSPVLPPQARPTTDPRPRPRRRRRPSSSAEPPACSPPPRCAASRPPWRAGRIPPDVAPREEGPSRGSGDRCFGAACSPPKADLRSTPSADRSARSTRDGPAEASRQSGGWPCRDLRGG